MIIPVILSGGSGSRLWPVSREARPKPFMRLSDGLSLLQTTYLRAANACNVKDVITVTNQEHFFQTQDEIQQLSKKISFNNSIFLLEPCSRNTAPAIALGAFLTEKMYGSDAIMLILPADHLIKDEAKFKLAVQHAARLAKQGLLVTFGVTPHKPETGYGYIECGTACDTEGGRNVAAFHEKPDVHKAAVFLEKGNYLWNSGMFCFTAATLKSALEAYAPELYTSIFSCWKNIENQLDNQSINIDNALFSKLPNISIDYALMEKAKNTAVIPVDFGWSDVGSWDSISETFESDHQGNQVIGSAILVDTHHTTIHNETSTKRIIATVGLKDVIVVDTPDALLIGQRSHMQQVKQVVEQLKASDHDAYKLHQTVHRPWGTYTVLEEGENFKLKRIRVKPGARLSLQSHQHRSEHWVVIQGEAKVINGDKELYLKAQESTFIPAGHKHRLSNPGETELVIIEVQTGTYLGEDDITRFDDIYRRK